MVTEFVEGLKTEIATLKREKEEVEKRIKLYDCGKGDLAHEGGEPCRKGPYPRSCLSCRLTLAVRENEALKQERDGWKQAAHEAHGAGGQVAREAIDLRTLAGELIEALSWRSEAFHEYIRTMNEPGSHMHYAVFTKCIHPNCQEARALLSRAREQKGEPS